MQDQCFTHTRTPQKIVFLYTAILIISNQLLNCFLSGCQSGQLLFYSDLVSPQIVYFVFCHRRVLYFKCFICNIWKQINLACTSCRENIRLLSKFSKPPLTICRILFWLPSKQKFTKKLYSTMKSEYEA